MLSYLVFPLQSHKNSILSFSNQFFTSISISGDTLDEQADVFIQKARTEGVQWIQNSLIYYVLHNKPRINETKDLTAGTLRHYITVVKLFCETNDELLPNVGALIGKR